MLRSESSWQVARLRPLRCRHARQGVAVLLVLAILAITVALAYGLSQSSSTMSRLSKNEHTSLCTSGAVNFAPGAAFDRLATDASWLPASNPIKGSFESGETFETAVQLTSDGTELGVAAAAQYLDPLDKTKLAEQHLNIELAKQRLDTFPTAAITALSSRLTRPSVYIANGSTVRGDIRSRGPIQFQSGFALVGTPYAMQVDPAECAKSQKYITYRAAWGTSYSATQLFQQRSTSGGSYALTDSSIWGGYLSNVDLGPTESNPMGVFYYDGDLTIGSNVTIRGTLAVTGDVTIVGPGIRLTALQGVKSPTSSKPITTSVPVLPYDQAAVPMLVPAETSIPVPVSTVAPVSAQTTIKTSFPAIVCDKSISFSLYADAVRISGLVLAGKDVVRVGRTSSRDAAGGWSYGQLDEELSVGFEELINGSDPHNHKLSIDSIPDPFDSFDGPAIYVKGAIMANRVKLQQVRQLPFALVFDATRTDTTDAPGFFTWRTAAWVEGN